jgi:hypothetical protein
MRTSFVGEWKKFVVNGKSIVYVPKVMYVTNVLFCTKNQLKLINFVTEEIDNFWRLRCMDGCFQIQSGEKIFNFSAYVVEWNFFSLANLNVLFTTTDQKMITVVTKPFQHCWEV